MPEHIHLLVSETRAERPTQAKIGLEWATCPPTVVDHLSLSYAFSSTM